MGLSGPQSGHTVSYETSLIIERVAPFTDDLRRVEAPISARTRDRDIFRHRSWSSAGLTKQTVDTGTEGSQSLDREPWWAGPLTDHLAHQGGTGR